MKYFSNEIVFRGHPDKVCDQIGAALLKEYIKGDSNTRAGIEVMGGKGIIFITGEVTSNTYVDVEKVTKRVLKDVGYPTNYTIINNIGKQSQDIALGTNDEVGGAGDQGMMFGYACNDTKEKLPTAMVILQKFAKAYDELRQKDTRFLSDGKAQITGEYDDNFRLTKIKDFVISYQNTELNRTETDNILKNIAKTICDEYETDIQDFHINPTGKFLIGGFEGDSGLTGRKIVVDAYQGFANVGGGNQNAKDPSKVDFSASHKAREIAKSYLEKYNLRWCEVQLSYAIGVEEPLAIYIDSNIGNIEPNKELYKECTPRRIIKDLDLKNADFEELAKFGHYTN